MGVSTIYCNTLLLGISKLLLQIDTAGDKVLLSDHYEANLTTRC